MGFDFKARVLVVDDDKKACAILRDYLTMQGFLVEVSYGGEEAIAKVHIFKPHVIVLDIRMPRLSGVELVKMIKGWKSDVEIIIVTAVGFMEVKDECLQHGAFACLDKPVKLDILQQKIEDALSQFKMTDLKNSEETEAENPM